MEYSSQLVRRFQELAEEGTQLENPRPAYAVLEKNLTTWGTRCLALLERTFGTTRSYYSNFRTEYDHKAQFAGSLNHVTGATSGPDGYTILHSKIRKCAGVFQAAALDYSQEAELQDMPAPAAQIQLLADALAAARHRIADLEAQVGAHANQPAAATTEYPDDLSPAQHRTGHSVLLAAFPKKAALLLVTREALGVNLAAISSEGDLSSVVADLLSWAAAKGKLPALLVGLGTANPDNKRLQAWLALLRAAGPSA